MTRHRNDGLRKLCDCARRTWAKCDHAWHFNFKWKNVQHRYSFDRLYREKRIRSKTDALAAADALRASIRDGTFRRPGDEPEAPALAALTVGQLVDAFTRARILRGDRVTPDQVAKVEKALAAVNDDLSRLEVTDAPTAAARSALYQVRAIVRVELPRPDGQRRAFGAWLVADVTTDTIEQFRAIRRARGAIAANRDISKLRGIFNWGIRVGYVERSPFKRGTEPIVKLTKETSRSRRLEPGEGERLQQACAPHLRALVEAALETGCRKGELLTLQWSQVRWTPKAEIFLPAAKTKTRRDRRIPISTRLRAILQMRQNGPDGEPHPPAAFVFGNEAGEALKTFKRAWERAVLVSHGHKPAYVKGTARLTAESRTALRGINLHFHDLRREAGSRWLESGIVPLHTVRDWLGHANISQTSTYLESTIAGQHDAMAAFDAKRGVVQPIATDSRPEDPSAASSDTMPPDTTQQNTERHH